MRTLISAILTIITYSLYAAIYDSIKYYKIMKLDKGINEGIYITLGSKHPLYIIKSLSTKWFYLIIIIAAVLTGQFLVQPLANLGIKTASVYIKNDSAAKVYNQKSLYNGVTEELITDAQFYFPSMMSALNTYSASSNSIYGMGGDGVIAAKKIGGTTNIIRNGYVIQQKIMKSNPTNSFETTEVIGILTTACNFSGQQIQSGYSFSIASNNGEVIGQIYFLEYEISSPNEAQFITAFSIGDIEKSSSLCSSRLIIQEYNIIYTVNTRAVNAINFVTNTTTVNITQLVQIVQNYAQSIEYVANISNSLDFQIAVNNVFLNFGPGLFEFTTSYICHSRLSGAISLGLQYLWENSLNNNTNTVFIPLSNNVSITYISIVDLWIISGSILAFTFIVCMFGIRCSYRCTLRVNFFEENAMINIIDPNTCVWEMMNRSLLPNQNIKHLGRYFLQNISYRNGRVGY